jgi:hypothetical protein
MKANVLSYNATFVTEHRWSSAQADLSENAAITLHVTSSIVTACFELKEQRRRTGQKEVKLRRLIQQMRLPHWIFNGHYTWHSVYLSSMRMKQEGGSIGKTNIFSKKDITHKISNLQGKQKGASILCRLHQMFWEVGYTPPVLVKHGVIIFLNIIKDDSLMIRYTMSPFSSSGS